MQDALAAGQSRQHEDGLPVLHDASRRTYLPRGEDWSMAEDWFDDLWDLCDRTTFAILTMSAVGMLYLYSRAEM